jgi:hypothetical protein
VDRGLFDLFRRFAAQAFESVRFPPLGQDEVLDLDPAAVAQSRRTTEDVLELSHVARPRVARRASAVSGESPSSLLPVSADILVSRCSAIGSMSSLCFRRGEERAYES